ncbi:MAG: FISUMP domain-containing protein [Sphingobacteriales bacterium]
MNKPFLILLFVTLLFSACSKKNNVSPTPSNQVNIGGTSYPTTTIGNQIWTTVNYSGAGGYSVTKSNEYGTFFTQAQALKIILPAGWRVPTIADYNKLLGNYTSTKDNDGYYTISGDGAAGALVSSSLTFGTNLSGFDALYAGYCTTTSGQFNDNTEYTQAYFLTADSLDEISYKIYGVMITSGSASITGYSNPGSLALSVRFVRDK